MRRVREEQRRTAIQEMIEEEQSVSKEIWEEKEKNVGRTTIQEMIVRERVLIEEEHEKRKRGRN